MDFPSCGPADRHVHDICPVCPCCHCGKSFLSVKFALIQYSFAILQGFEYGRSGNPTRDSLEKALASLEKAQYGKELTD